MTTEFSYKRIMVATDFTESSEVALKQAIWLAHRTGASIVLAHVLPARYSPATSDSMTPEAGPKMNLLTDLWVNEGSLYEQLESNARQDAEAKLHKLIEQSARSIDVQTRVFVGASFAQIIFAVEKERCDLVIAGTRGLSQWEQFLVGSTAKQLVRKCPSSVWIVKAEHVGQPRVVLAATDFSDVSLKAATEGLWLAQLADAEFHLLHVVDSKDAPEDSIYRIPMGSSLQQEINEKSSQRMNAFLDSFQVDRSNIQVHLAWGTPWKEVRRIAKHQAADLVVIGTVGRSGIQGLLLGNTAEKLLDTCDCSILTVKSDAFVAPIGCEMLLERSRMKKQWMERSGKWH